MLSLKTTSVLLCLFLATESFAQTLVANAGLNEVFCQQWTDTAVIGFDTIQIGGVPAASGGTAPYIYTWDIYPKPYIPFPLAPQINHSCSYYLSDTTIANPLLYSLPQNEPDLVFILTVVDDSGAVATDTVKFLYTSWTISLGHSLIFTFPGDTQLITPSGLSGGFPPYSIDWGTSDSIIGGRFDSNLALIFSSRQVIIPYKIGSTISYEMLVTDSIGCSFNLSSFQEFKISPAFAPVAPYESGLQLFPNPVSNELTIRSREHLVSLAIFDEAGRKVDAIKFDTNTSDHTIYLGDRPNGFYNILIKTSKGRIFKKIIKVSN